MRNMQRVIIVLLTLKYGTNVNFSENFKPTHSIKLADFGAEPINPLLSINRGSFA